MALLSCNGVFERLPNGSRLTLDLLAPRHRDRLLSPRAQRLRVVEEVGGHLVILHDLPMLSVRSEWAHVARLEVGAIGLIHLQVERVIGDQGEKAIAGVDADTAMGGPTPARSSHTRYEWLACGLARLPATMREAGAASLAERRHAVSGRLPPEFSCAKWESRHPEACQRDVILAGREAAHSLHRCDRGEGARRPCALRRPQAAARARLRLSRSTDRMPALRRAS